MDTPDSSGDESDKTLSEVLYDTLAERGDDVVRRELDLANEPYDAEIVAFILNHAKKIFAIAAVADSNPSWLLRAMKIFQSNGIKDSSLSAEITDNGGSSPQTASFNERLLKLQKLDPPVFSTARSNYDFARETIFPFTEIERDIKGGAFSSVHKVSIHQDHYQDTDCIENERPTHFAIKKIVPPDKYERERMAQSWGREATTLKTMNMRKKQHIVRFITAFTRGGPDTEKSYYLMFEWADGGSLEDLWRENPKPALSTELVKEAVMQFRGLAEALYATHYQENGVGFRHGDVKPENILRFRPRPESILGTLKIGDWGLAKYHNTATILRGENTTTKYGTALYEPPEVELGDVTVLGRRYDIWSMGCIILELIIWLLYGYDDVKRFRAEIKGDSAKQVPCYRIENNNQAKVHEIVVRWMHHIAQDPACAGDLAMGELLKLVRTRLLVVELPPSIGQTMYIKEWNPEISQGSSDMQTPTIAVTPESRPVESDLQPGLRGQAYRATSKDLMAYLDNQILDEDHAEDFWFREAPPEFQRRGPPEPIKISIKDESGFLMPSKEPMRQSSRDRGPVSGMRRLEVQDQKFVPAVPYT
ncbi:hypothetical protein G7Y89_g12243 [Cudoniella acicularis]|uniref:Protein kinase domain-containing protein n=1 Tax=Cudoniella acicularis TaxID=354080 RepID=A0A8H4R9H7_9HELO|nr:hypothetical protein G7Y89_g12243 [Cudoniella acicularis]